MNYKKKTDIKPLNEDGQRHGYHELYHTNNGRLHYKGNFINGLSTGYWESYTSDGEFWYKGNQLNGLYCGYTEWGHGMKRFYLI